MSKESRLYGLFEKKGNRWVNLHSALAFKKSVAVRLFQDKLLNATLLGNRHLMLRPVPYSHLKKEK